MSKIIDGGFEQQAPNPHKGEYGTSNRQDRAAEIQEQLGQGLFDKRDVLEKIADDEQTAKDLPTA